MSLQQNDAPRKDWLNIDAVNWVLNDTFAKGNDLVMLIALAKHAHPSNWACYPSVAALANLCHVDHRTAQRLLKNLENAGYITRESVPFGGEKFPIEDYTWGDKSCTENVGGGDKSCTGGVTNRARKTRRGGDKSCMRMLIIYQLTNVFSLAHDTEITFSSKSAKSQKTEKKETPNKKKEKKEKKEEKNSVFFQAKNKVSESDSDTEFEGDPNDFVGREDQDYPPLAGDGLTEDSMVCSSANPGVTLEGHSGNQRFPLSGFGESKGAVEMERYGKRSSRFENSSEESARPAKAKLGGGGWGQKSGGVSDRPSRRSESKSEGGSFAQKKSYPEKLEPLAKRFKGNFNSAFNKHPEWADLTPSNITALCDGRLDQADKPWEFEAILEPFLLAIRIEKDRAEMKPASKFVAPYIVEDLFTGKKLRRGTLEDGTTFEEEV